MQTAMGFGFNEGGGRYFAEEMIDYVMQRVAVFVGAKTYIVMRKWVVRKFDFRNEARLQAGQTRQGPEEPYWRTAAQRNLLKFSGTI